MYFFHGKTNHLSLKIKKRIEFKVVHSVVHLSSLEIHFDSILCNRLIVNVQSFIVLTAPDSRVDGGRNNRERAATSALWSLNAGGRAGKRL